jgi:23S rRNA (uracil1939-C5)-methyltransferase
MENFEDVEIESLAYTGNGVAHLVSGKTVFVADAAPGDLVRIRIDEERDRFANASIAEILRPSTNRIPPTCPYADRCGGCGLQHIVYEEQLRWKRRFVVDALERIGKRADAEEIVGAIAHTSPIWGYRNKVELEPLWTGKRLSLGFHAKGSNEIVPVERCLLFPKGFENLPKRLAGALGFALNDSASPLKRVGVRVSRQTGDVEIALWTEPGGFNRAFVGKILGDSLKTTSLVRVLAKGPIQKRDIRGVEALSGKGFWEEKLAGFDFKISAPSFFQVNTNAAKLLIEQVLADVEPEGKLIADLCSGAGTFTLPLADVADDVIAIEIEGSSVRDLRRNLLENELDAEVLGGGVEYLLPDLDDLDAAVIDPPRSGLSETAREAIAASSIKRLVYVSCNPTTLARDAKDLAEAGFTLIKATPVDLFPQTYHVETVAVLER